MEISTGTGQQAKRLGMITPSCCHLMKIYDKEHRLIFTEHFAGYRLQLSGYQTALITSRGRKSRCSLSKVREKLDELSKAEGGTRKHAPLDTKCLLIA